MPPATRGAGAFDRREATGGATETAAAPSSGCRALFRLPRRGGDRDAGRDPARDDGERRCGGAEPLGERLGEVGRRAVARGRVGRERAQHHAIERRREGRLPPRRWWWQGQLAFEEMRGAGHPAAITADAARPAVRRSIARSSASTIGTPRARRSSASALRVAPPTLAVRAAHRHARAAGRPRAARRLDSDRPPVGAPADGRRSGRRGERSTAVRAGERRRQPAHRVRIERRPCLPVRGAVDVARRDPRLSAGRGAGGPRT